MQIDWRLTVPRGSTVLEANGLWVKSPRATGPGGERSEDDWSGGRTVRGRLVWGANGPRTTGLGGERSEASRPIPSERIITAPSVEKQTNKQKTVTCYERF